MCPLPLSFHCLLQRRVRLQFVYIHFQVPMERARPAVSVLFLRLNRFSSLSLSQHPVCFSQLTFLELLQQNYSVYDCFSSVGSSKTGHSAPRCGLTIAEQRGRFCFPDKTADPNMCCCMTSFHPQCKQEMDLQTHLKKQTLFPPRAFGHVKRDH